MSDKNYGFRTRRMCDDPNTAKVCRGCDFWFNPRPKEQLCDGCVPGSVRARRHANDPHPPPHTRTPGRRGKRAGQGTQESEVLGLTFNPGVPLWKVLAFEEGARQDATRRRPKR